MLFLQNADNNKYYIDNHVMLLLLVDPCEKTKEMTPHIKAQPVI